MYSNFGDFQLALDLCLAICGFKDTSSLKEAGYEEAVASPFADGQPGPQEGATTS